MLNAAGAANPKLPTQSVAPTQSPIPHPVAMLPNPVAMQPNPTAMQPADP